MDESFELKLSLWVCLGLSGVYVAYELLADPSGGQPFGHWLGIGGALLMVSTEILYSVRKRTAWLRWAGPVRHWLSFHIFTGIVGPFLVLMHTAFAFRGLAGLTMLLTALVAASGFIGRFLYTAIPHSLAGTEASSDELVDDLQRTQAALEALVNQRPPRLRALVAADSERQRVTRGDMMLVLLRGWDEWRYRLGLRRKIRALEKAEGAAFHDVEGLLLQRRTRERQMRMIQASRRLLSVWHIAHVPMGVALFSSLFIHVSATLYFGAGLWH
jgi:hypothetical protein